MIRNIYHDSLFPFSIKIRISSGILKRIDRSRIDFLGAPIDEISKILGEESDPHAILLSRPYYEKIEKFITDYNFISLEGLKFWKVKYG